MEDTTSRSSVAALRAQFSSRIPPSDERVGASDELLSEADSTPETPSAPSRRRKQAPTTSEFSGSLVPAQFKLPADLVQSLKLHAIDTGVKTGWFLPLVRHTIPGTNTRSRTTVRLSHFQTACDIV